MLPYPRVLLRPALISCTLFALVVPLGAQPAEPAAARCEAWARETPPRNPTASELRCRYGVEGPGRFGLLWYLDVPSYQPANPLPGTHVVGVAGMPAPAPGESFEHWEWRVLRTEHGPEVRRAYRQLEVLDPIFAGRLMDLEARLQAEGIGFHRRETWRAPARQAYLFQQGRSRPGPLVTATLTSWHTVVDARGNPAGRAADYNVAGRHMPRFHQLAEELGLSSYGADSHDAGHIYLPRPNDVEPLDVTLLRLLPRVPIVTLATGRPFDEEVSRERRAEIRAAAAEFAGDIFYPHPAARVVFGPPTPTPVLDRAGTAARTAARRPGRTGRRHRAGSSSAAATPRPGGGGARRGRR
jgi:hypothetical protein